MKRRLILIMSICVLLFTNVARSEIKFAGSTLWTDPRDVTVKDGIAYCSYMNGLFIIDVSKPESPSFVSKLFMAGEGRGLTLKNDLVYLADGSAGLRIIDVSDRSSAEIISTYDTPGIALDVFVDENTAYVADDSSGIQIIDVGDPGNPKLITQYDTPGYTQSIFINNNYAYVSDGFSLLILDIGNFEKIAKISEISRKGYEGRIYYGENKYSDAPYIFIDHNVNEKGWVVGAVVVGDYVYVVDGSSFIWFVNIKDLSNPKIKNMYKISSPNAIISDRNTLYIGYGNPGASAGILTLNTSKPDTPDFVQKVESNSDVLSLDLKNRYLYEISGGYRSTSELEIFNNEDSPNLIPMGKYENPCYPGDISISGNYVFTANGESGIFISDFGDFDNPKSLSNITFEDYLKEDIFYYEANNVFVSGGYLYSVISLHEYDCGTWPNLVCIDISNIKEPVKLGICEVDESCGWSSAYSMHVKDNLAFIPYINSPRDSSGLAIIDVENRHNPVLVSKLSVNGRPLDILVEGDYAYITNGDSAFEIIDISDPANPYIVSEMGVEGEPFSIAKRDSLVYISAGYSIELVNVSNVKEPEILRLFDSIGLSKSPNHSIYIESLDIYENTLYLSLNGFGSINESSYLLKLDISDPIYPEILEEYKIAGSIEKVAVFDNNILLGARSSLIMLQED
jgi:hypothetical protein